MKFLRKLKKDTWLPYFMPNVWHWLICILFAVSMLLGAWVWLYTLTLRGLW